MIARICNLALHWQILIALLLAILFGSLTTADSVVAGISLLSILDFVGTLFLNALKMIVVPLIVSSIIVGIASVAGDNAFGRLGIKTLGYYLFTSTIAIITGLLAVNLINPGGGNEHLAGELLATLSTTPDFMAQMEAKSTSDIAGVFLRMVPANVFKAATEGQLLGLIFFSAVFGFFITRINDTVSVPMLTFWQGVQDVMIKITLWIMKFAPIGVFALVGKTLMQTGFDTFIPVLKFFFTVVLALGIHFIISMPLLLRFIGKVNPWRYIERVSPALLTAFSTASSSATLPISLNSAQERAGISKKVSSFVLPLGATINMDGTALYECVVVIFIAQLFGVDLSIGTQFTIVLLALLTSIGVAGIPAASLVAITIILTAVNLPVEAIALVLVVDRLLDMGRTATNVFGDLSGACLVARSEGEELPPLRKVA